MRDNNKFDESRVRKTQQVVAFVHSLFLSTSKTSRSHIWTRLDRVLPCWEVFPLSGIGKKLEDTSAGGLITLLYAHSLLWQFNVLGTTTYIFRASRERNQVPYQVDVATRLSLVNLAPASVSGNQSESGILPRKIGHPDIFVYKQNTGYTTAATS